MTSMLVCAAGSIGLAYLAFYLESIAPPPANPTDSTLSAAAAWAYCRWPLAAQDAEVVATVQARLPVSRADARKAYLRSLAVLGVAPNPQTQAQLELIATSDRESASHRKIASTILLNFANIEN